MRRLTVIMLVALTLLGADQTVAADPPPGGVCIGGQWCTFDATTGSLSCTASEQCQSEGEEEEGATGCTPGSWIFVVDCDRVRGAYYQCQGDGTWAQIWEGSYGCQEGTEGRYACWWDDEAFQNICVRLPGNETPCEDLDFGAAGIQCTGAYSLTVSVSVPCQRVARQPYPRGMVIVPNRLWITADSPQWSEAWSQTLDYNACLARGIREGDRLVRDFRIGLAWGRENRMPPYWVVGGSSQGRGWSVSVAWERSSWGQDVCGPGRTPGQKLPAWRVSVYTYWNAFWRRVYERQKKGPECVHNQAAGAAGRCECLPDFAPPGSSCTDDTNNDSVSDWAGWVIEERLCDDDANSDGVPDNHCWETVDSGWVGIDLRRFGYPTSYFVSGKAGPAATSLEPNPGCGDICVPVIEVQGIIRNPRGH